MSPYKIKKRGYSYFVLDADDEVVGGGFTSHAMAALSMERLQRASQSGYRPCMSCQKPFLSEGSHNRLCPRCKSRAD